ncbi:hypothetical protein HRI_003506800 [Hibiscus trionum]|uniref:CCHC-type domain-containing protein n=1 Tax=Hibiscus trionum TaxID=183268 RepID=A0A9W7MHP7_HIBTR|nr:hypothetical protein HRI_003506800 [Hibiscus trionum]
MADDMKLQQSLQGSSVSDIPKTETETCGKAVLLIHVFALDDMKCMCLLCRLHVNRKAMLLTSQKLKLRYVRDYFPAPPESPEDPDVWREQRWKDILSKEERTQQCTRCNEIGHGRHHCPYPVVRVLYTVDGEPRPMVCKPPEGKYRCSRCGRRGHNRRTCHGPVFY